MSGSFVDIRYDREVDVFVRWLLYAGEYGCVSASIIEVVIIVRWLLYAYKFRCISSSMVDSWLLL